jgi:hypothetical protein
MRAYMAFPFVLLVLQQSPLVQPARPPIFVRQKWSSLDNLDFEENNVQPIR